VGLVAVLAGLLFAWNAKAAQGSDLRDAPGLRGMLTARDRQVEELGQRNTDLAARVAAMMEQAGAPSAAPDSATALAAGAVDVEGPGVTVTLDDSQTAADVLADSAPAPSDRLVHQQDIDAVMNALWTGGAEAMAVQGHRVTSHTAVKCVGNVILVAGRVHSPPYTIAAIGPEAGMREALDAAPVVHAYRERASRLGLTWAVSGDDRLVIAADSPGSVTLRYARLADEALEGNTP
jgi:uncharacterized protein YlxW (UPF0749 family)